MRYSDLVHQTLHKAPAEAVRPSHQILLKGGYILPAGNGQFHLTVLGRSVVEQLRAFCQKHLNVAEIELNPLQHNLMNVLDFASRQFRSYKQLPATVFQTETVVHEVGNTHDGLFGSRHSTQLSLFTFNRSHKEQTETEQPLLQCLTKIFADCELPFRVATAMSDYPNSRAICLPHPEGNETLLHCPVCDYAAMADAATTRKPAAPADITQRPMQKVHTPGTKTIADLSTFLNISPKQTAKAVFFMATINDENQPKKKLVLAIVRGDMDVNEVKLKIQLAAASLRPAENSEILACGAVAGFASPVGAKNVLVIVDDLIPQSPNLVAGANETDYHITNMNYGRDFQADIVADITVANAGDACPHCGKSLAEAPVFTVGGIETVPPELAKQQSATFLDENNTQQPVLLSTASLNLTRLLAAIVEFHHDEYGPIWPQAAAPFAVELVLLNGNIPEISEQGEQLYSELGNAGIAVLLDDRAERPGSKFADADLFGCPIRLTLGRRSLEAGGVEYKKRTAAEKTILPLAKVLPEIQAELSKTQ